MLSGEGGIIKHFVNEIKICILKHSCPFSSFGKCLYYSCLRLQLTS